jgi:hypothetical protein
MSSSRESGSSGSDGPLSRSIKSLPDWHETPHGPHRPRKSSVPGSRYSDSVSHYARPLSVVYKTEKTTTGLFRKKTTVVDCGAFIKDDG